MARLGSSALDVGVATGTGHDIDAALNELAGATRVERRATTDAKDPAFGRSGAKRSRNARCARNRILLD